MFIKPLTIGNVTTQNNLILAPMAGFTDLPFRIACKQQGAGLVCTEMASSKAIFYGDQKTKSILKVTKEERPIQAQIFGSDIESMQVAAQYVSEFADILDINMGCPAPKIVKNGDGSKLLSNLSLVEEIVTQVVKVAKIPVTVKIRKGWRTEVAQEVAKIIEHAGASAITVHGRMQNEFFQGKVDLECIRKVKESVKIPVIGNGNVVDEESALQMFETTGVDGIMIGRAAIGDPWIFSRLCTFFKTGEKQKELPQEEKWQVIFQHIESEVQEKGEKVGIQELRKHLAQYVRQMEFASKIRMKINTIETKQELEEYLEEVFCKRK